MLVWDRCVGLDQGSATCICGTKIYQLSHECGHIQAWSRGGSTTVDNLIVICSSCNKAIGNQNLVDYVISIGATYNLQSDFPLFSLVNLNKLVGATKKEEATGEWDFVIIARTRKGAQPEPNHLALQQPKISTRQALIVIGTRASEAASPYLSRGAEAAQHMWGAVKNVAAYYWQSKK
jgi:HNH endonuclease